MASTGIVTDSTACLPQELVRRHQILVVPVKLFLEGKVYRDGIDLSPDEFYRRLRSAPELPTTTAPSPGSYLEAFRQLSQRHRSILCVTASSRLTMMHQAACLARDQAREELPDVSIAIMDSRRAAMAQGLIVLAAAQTLEGGGSLPQAAAAAARVRARVQLIGVIDTLFYLARGGRLPWIKALSGSLLQIKPIFQFTSQGQVVLRERVRSKAHAVKRMLEMVAEAVTPESQAQIAVMHAAAPEEAVRLTQAVASRFPAAQIYQSEFTPVMGAHSGPGVLALAFCPELSLG